MKRRTFLLGTGATLAAGMMPLKAAETFTITQPMDPPEWALLERELLHAHTAACVAFFKRYFNQATGWLETTERWGGDDGPDDAIENVNDWPHLYALGGDEVIRQMYTKAYEGHVAQYTAAKTTDVPFARQGMYFKEFPVQMDWQHNGEGLTVFNLMPLGAPYDQRYRERVKRFAGFYMGEDPGAPNYDPKLKLIKSLMNGSRGPMLREATALDWTGDPIDVQNRFPSLGHGEGNYEGMLAHFKDYNDVVGDHPLNLAATQLATNAYMLTHEAKYKNWVLGYCDAWAQRAKDNGGIIPSKVGLDGKIGGPENKWYAGVYGWGFSPIVPMTGKREDRNRVPWCVGGFYNAYLLWADRSYDLNLLGMRMPTTFLATLDATVSVLFLVAVVAFWRWYGKRWREPDEITKVALGCFISSIAFVILALVAAHAAATGTKVSLWVAVAVHSINSIGFANVFPVSLALYSRAAPRVIAATMLGIYYLFLFGANTLVGWVGAWLDQMPPMQFWGLHAGLIVAAGVVFVVVRVLFGGLLRPDTTEPALQPAG